MRRFARNGACCTSAAAHVRPRLALTQRAMPASVPDVSLSVLTDNPTPKQAWTHKTLTNRGRYTITWSTGGDESGLLHYALPHQQVGTGLFGGSSRWVYLCVQACFESRTDRLESRTHMQRQGHLGSFIPRRHTPSHQAQEVFVLAATGASVSK